MPGLARHDAMPGQCSSVLPERSSTGPGPANPISTKAASTRRRGPNFDVNRARNVESKTRTSSNNNAMLSRTPKPRAEPQNLRLQPPPAHRRPLTPGAIPTSARHRSAAPTSACPQQTSLGGRSTEQPPRLESRRVTAASRPGERWPTPRWWAPPARSPWRTAWRSREPPCRGPGWRPRRSRYP